MNEKFEDKLIRLAFEETNQKEASALEHLAQVDPEAARTLETYRQVRIGLNLLTDVPPDQLSKERLRNAILGQGLKPLPAPQPSRWGWAWMPATAFALVFGWLTVRHLDAPIPQVVQAGGGSVARLESHPVKLDVKPVEHSSAPRAMVVGEKKVPSSRVHETPKPRLEEPPVSQGLVVYNTSKQVKPPITLVSTPKSAPTPPADKPTPTSDTPTNNPGKLASINSPMVVINPENDNSSGAQKATEVDGASNVVVGG